MPKRTQKLLISTLLTLAVLVLGSYLSKYSQTPVTPAKPPAPAGYYNVTQFNDGDTITVDMAGREEKIRMIGVDTPETEDPRKPVQCFGKAASQFTKDLIGTNPVRLEADPTNTNRDRYNRLLRYVYLPDQTLVNAAIIKQGYGFAYTGFPFEKMDEFKALQTEAQNAEQGLWKDCTPEKNKYGGYSSNPE